MANASDLPSLSRALLNASIVRWTAKAAMVRRARMVSSSVASRMETRRLLCAVAAVFLAGPACILPLPCPKARSGQVRTVEGSPVAGADIRVESWDVSMPGAFKESLVHTSFTKTDSEGRWAVPGGATLRFALPVPEMPVVADELTVQVAGMAPVHIAVGFRSDDATVAREASTLRVTWDGPAPRSVLILPAFGILVGAGQQAAVHGGGLIIVGRDNLGVGLRGELGAGINAASAAAGILIAFRPTTPIIGIELNGRYMRPWSSDNDRRAEWAPEIGLDLDSWRLTIAALGSDVLTPLDQRRVVVGFGWGYF